MALQLPVDLENEILGRLLPRSLVRLRSVCKRWNSLLKDKSFVNNYLSRSRPQIGFNINSRVYLIDVIDLDPKSIGQKVSCFTKFINKIKNIIRPRMKCDITSFDIPLDDPFGDVIGGMGTCDEFLFYIYVRKKVIGLWNPLLKQIKWLEYKNETRYFCVFGLGYDNSRPEKAYKVLGFVFSIGGPRRAAIYDCTSQVFKFIDQPNNIYYGLSNGSNVGLNGYLYWVSRNRETHEWFIQSFDFSLETFKPFCLLPCHHSYGDELLVLAAFQVDRFSLLKYSFLTKNVEVWVTKNKICIEEIDVVWIKLMNLPTTNFPRRFIFLPCISYFIYDKTLFMLCEDFETGFVCIYIVREDLCKRIQLVPRRYGCRHFVFTPNFISIP